MWLGTGDGLFVVQNPLTDINSFESSLSTEIILHPNYPNPFNPSTTISFKLPIESNVSLVVYDQLGQEITELIDRKLKAGYHEIDFKNISLSSGIYFYRIKAGDYVKTKKMILMK